MNDFPTWLESDQAIGEGAMWPLGIEAQGFRFVSRLLYGLTGNTNNIRYYSFLSWVFWTFMEACDRGKVVRSPAAQKAWRDRLEMLFRLASLRHSPEVSGLIGVSQIGRPVADAAGMVPLHVSRTVTTAFKAAAYSASFVKFGCGRILSNKLVQLSEEVGLPLARAFNARLRQVASDEDMAWIISTKMAIPSEMIDRVSEAMALRFVHPEEAEHPVLVDMLFRLRPSGDPAVSAMDVARSRSLTLLLELVHQAGGRLTGDYAVHAVFATRRLPDGSPFVIPAELEDIFLRWERYQERQFEKIALYGLWAVLVRLIESGMSHPDRLSGALRIAIRDAEVSREWFPESALSARVSDLEATLLQRVAAAGNPAGTSQVELVAQIRNRETSWQNRAAASIALLLLTTAAWRVRQERLPRALRRLHEEGDRERLCLAGVARDVARHGTDTLGTFAAWALRTYILTQANQTALTKLVQQGQYQFFIAQDESGYRLVKPFDPHGTLVYDRPNINQALWMLAELHLIERASAAVTITPNGMRLLAAAKAYHQMSDMVTRAA